MQPPGQNQEQQPAIYGLAADLAQGGSTAAHVPHGRNPAFGLGNELGPLGQQKKQLQMRQRPRPGEPAGSKNALTGQPSNQGAFGMSSEINLAQATRQPRTDAGPSAIARPGDPNPAPYGLALELAHGGQIFQRPDAVPHQGGSRSAKRTLNQQMAEAGNYTIQPGTLPQQQQQMYEQSGVGPSYPGLPPGYSGMVMPEEEPDYGIVAELRQAGPLDPMSHGFGLAAEVARRRGGGPLPPGGRYGSTNGSSLPPMRPRKRLAAVGPPAQYGMSPELAELQEQMERDRLDPFGAANRASGQDPFIMADNLVKFPTLPVQPQELQEQELVEGPIPLKLGDVSTDLVSGDDQHYGLASSLGAEEVDPAAAVPDGGNEAGLGEIEDEEQQRQRVQELLDWEPPGDKYAYNEETGMLETVEGGRGTGGRMAKEYIEDGATGEFYKLHDPGVWRKITRLFEGKPEEEESDQARDKSLRALLRVHFFQASNIYMVFSIFVQGLLFGFALLNYFCTARLRGGRTLEQFLQYYAPNSLDFSRIYYSLITFSAISATARFTHDQLHGFQPLRLRLRWVDGIQVLLYVAAYLMTVLCTPLDDELTFEYNQNPMFYTMTLNSKLESRLSSWLFFNLLRTVFSALGVLLLLYQLSPYVFMHTVNYETRERLREILDPSAPRADPGMAMMPMTTLPALRSRRVTQQVVSTKGKEHE